MSGNALVVEQATPLAPPEEHAAQNAPADDGFIDLDAGDSLLDGQPDDGKDFTGDESSPSKEAKEPEPEKATAGDSEGDDDATIAALRGEPEPEPEGKRLSGSARLKAKLAEAQAEVERLRRAQPKVDDATVLSQAIEAEIGPPPKESDFADYLAFQEAGVAYRTAAMLVGRELKKNAEATKTAVQEHNNAVVAEFRERAVEVRKIVKDFDAVVAAATVSPNNAEVAMAILESDKGPHIAYYLSKNPELVHEINGMSTRQALREIGRLEARLTPAPKKESRAPAPVPPVRGATTAKTKSLGDYSSEEIERMPMEQFSKLYAAEKKRKG